MPATENEPRSLNATKILLNAPTLITFNTHLKPLLRHWDLLNSLSGAVPHHV